MNEQLNRVEIGFGSIVKFCGHTARSLANRAGEKIAPFMPIVVVDQRQSILQPDTSPPVIERLSIDPQVNKRIVRELIGIDESFDPGTATISPYENE